MLFRQRFKPSIITSADQAQQAGNWALAAERYSEALARNPRNSPIWVQYGHALKECGRLAEAEVAYRNALAYNPQDADARFQLGHVLKLQHKGEEAQSAYLHAFALDPSLQDCLHELSNLGWSVAEISELKAAGSHIAIGGLVPREDPAGSATPSWRIVAPKLPVDVNGTCVAAAESSGFAVEPTHRPLNGSRRWSLASCYKIDLPKIQDHRGNLTFIEGNAQIPFEIKRIYYLYDVPGGAERAGHSHHTLHQVFLAASGSFDLVITDGVEERTIHLNRSYTGFYLCPMIWRVVNNFSTGAVCLVLASAVYDESDYIRHYDEYLRVLGQEHER
jgi:tetratricopeptide (TPR) repeat protein